MAASNAYTLHSIRLIDDEDTRLPTGRCNYTNLSGGANAPRCGCRRFWHKASGPPGSNIENGTGFCMCEHHACFHDEVSQGDLNPVARLSSGARTPQIHLQLHEDIGKKPTEPATEVQDWDQFVSSGSLPAIPSQCLLPSETGSVTSGSQSRYTRPFGGLGMDTLSRVAKPGSDIFQPQETSRKQMVEDAHGNAFLQSLTEVATPSIRASQDVNHDVEFGNTIASAKEVLEKIAEVQSQKTFAMRGIRDDNSISIKQSASHPQAGLYTISAKEDDDIDDHHLIPRLRNIVNTLSQYPTKIQNHEGRLDNLENVSFDHGMVQDLQGANARVDLRCDDLEDRMKEIEKVQAALNDLNSVNGRHADHSFTSYNSESSSAMIASAIDSSRIEALEAQVSELQASALPSRSRPWEVEVVFLPYGPQLMGIWSHQHGMSQRSRHDSTAPDDWPQTQLQHDYSLVAVQSHLIEHEQTSAWERSISKSLEGQDEQPEWHFARACGLRSRVDERLRSRGLVKRIEICGPDARDVQAAIMTAFGDLPSVLTEDCYSQRDENAGAVPRSQKQYLGLQADWIPLRKIHKNSCLRFLTTSEMVTPALWTVPFLSSSVAMRHSSLRRLYVTHRDSYIQHLGHQTSDWTWAKLRQLPRYYQHAPPAHTPEADAHEPCWEFDDRLDPPNQSLHNSFASQISELSIESPRQLQQDFGHQQELKSPSDHFSSAPPSPGVSTTPTSIAPPAVPLSPLKERNPFRPIHTRTSSMPSLVPMRLSQGGKRRITSFERASDDGARSSPTPLPAPLNLSMSFSMSKRRRISRSPSRPRDTPRWSNGPPSPYDVATTGGREACLTPFAYATPHSNAPYVGPRSNVDVYEDDGEHETSEQQRPGSTTDQNDDSDDGAEENALSDYDGGAQDRQFEVEWEGVQEQDDFDDDEAGSEKSSVPSEYPSNQQGVEAFRGVKTEKGFRIHVDGDLNETV